MQSSARPSGSDCRLFRGAARPLKTDLLDPPFADPEPVRGAAVGDAAAPEALSEGSLRSTDQPRCISPLPTGLIWDESLF